MRAGIVDGSLLLAPRSVPLSSDPAQPVRARRPVAGCNLLPLHDLTSSRHLANRFRALAATPRVVEAAPPRPASVYATPASRSLGTDTPSSLYSCSLSLSLGSDASARHRVRYPPPLACYQPCSRKSRLRCPPARRTAGVRRRVAPPVRGRLRYSRSFSSEEAGPASRPC